MGAVLGHCLKALRAGTVAPAAAGGKAVAQARHRPKAQANLIDPDSRIMKH
ncbi:hypothetical protein OG426_01795 [Streptomyces canus]|uniref:hypothetical protein n=1 Tax=Streptomyces canus TaxID=58343 RepID=UPI00225C20A7|nr:hypothetical protein [Streptomyces canus]MCX4853473.1 hypothetical protein [Streptomyces canus]WSW41287.1 hypothetical protein OG426_01795 [Streptomyces canus]